MIKYDYSNMSSSDIEAGFFEVENKQKISLKTKHQVFYFNENLNKKINSDTIVLYYNGAFSTFHDGHSLCIKNAYEEMIKRKIENFIIVISPSHTSYSLYKYKDYDISNKSRYDRIKLKCLESLSNDILDYLCIDLEPMLNYTEDQNFPDLILDFCNSFNIKIGNKHAVICGKDKTWNKLTELTKLNILFNFVENDSIYNFSSKDEIHKYPKKNKKKLYLRCINEEQYILFCFYFKGKYTTIEPIYLKDEIFIAKKMAIENKIQYTNCKEYADFLNYIPYSRTYINPLENTINLKPILNKNVTSILDSDVYSGGTKIAFENIGVKFYSVYDLQNKTDEYELLDVLDMYDDKLNYPFYDISSKFSISPFDKEDYKVFNQFKKEMKNIKF